MYDENDFIQLSSIQHFRFCKRQFYLSYIEEIWIENYLTADGRLLHQHVDDIHKEKRKDIIQEFGLSICSYDLGISGRTDVVEFHHDSGGQFTKIIPVEYKRGTEKKDNCDSLQLCAQALCLEEMTGVEVSSGYLFYGKERRRKEVLFLNELRLETFAAFKEIHNYYDCISIPPKAEYSQKCKACSFLEYCKPKSVGKKKSTVSFLEKVINEVQAT